jgi:signal transduction histidine kinase
LGSSFPAKSAILAVVLPTAQRLALVFFASAVSATAGAEPTYDQPFWFPSFRRLQHSYQTLQAQIQSLPPLPAHENRGACLGYHSEFSSKSDTLKEIQIDTGSVHPIESVVLVPVQIPGLAHTGLSYGFPKRFKVELSLTPDFADPISYADFSSADFPDPGRLPVELSPASVGFPQARYVRLQVTRLAGNAPQHFFALGELFIFSGGKRLLDPVHPDKMMVTDSFGSHPTWRGRNLLDLQTSLGPAVGQSPSPSLGWRAEPSKTPPEALLLVLDLGTPQPVTEIRIHPALPSDFPRGTSFAFPKEFMVESSIHEDFRQRSGLFKSPAGDFPEPGNNPVSIRVKPHTARYIRFHLMRTTLIKAEYECALSEIEVFSDNLNIALHRSVTASSSAALPQWNTAALTDGFNSNTNLVDFKPWLSALSQRRVLESELDALSSTIQLRSARSQKTARLSMAGLVFGALFFAAYSAWRTRNARRRDLLALQQRISRDLHDEIGSNLGTISMLSQIALDPKSTEAQIRSDLREIAAVARQSVDAMRDLIWLLQRDSATRADFLAEIRITAQTLLPGVEWYLDAEENHLPPTLPFDVRRNAFLALKEMLHNAAKHASPTRVQIRISQASPLLKLSVTDNGKGFDPATVQAGIGLHSLRARAEALGGQVCFDSAHGKGTTIHFHIPLHT